MLISGSTNLYEVALASILVHSTRLQNTFALPWTWYTHCCHQRPACSTLTCSAPPRSGLQRRQPLLAPYSRGRGPRSEPRLPLPLPRDGMAAGGRPIAVVCLCMERPRLPGRRHEPQALVPHRLLPRPRLDATTRGRVYVVLSTPQPATSPHSRVCTHSAVAE